VVRENLLTLYAAAEQGFAPHPGRHLRLRHASARRDGWDKRSLDRRRRTILASMGRGGRWMLAAGLLGACGGQTDLDLEAQPTAEGGAASPNVGGTGSIGGTGDSGAADAIHETIPSFDAAFDAAPGDALVDPAPVDGGVGPWGHDDKLGDVTRPASDVLEAAVYVSEELVDFRLRFAATPLQPDATNDLTWCVDLEQNQPDAGCAGAPPDGVFLRVSYSPPSSYYVLFAGQDFDPCAHVAYEASTKTLRIVLPRSALLDDGLFNYTVQSNFGGSFGQLDDVPDPIAPFLTSVVLTELPAFAASPSCNPPAPD